MACFCWPGQSLEKRPSNWEQNVLKEISFRFAMCEASSPRQKIAGSTPNKIHTPPTIMESRRTPTTCDSNRSGSAMSTQNQGTIIHATLPTVCEKVPSGGCVHYNRMSSHNPIRSGSGENVFPTRYTRDKMRKYQSCNLSVIHRAAIAPQTIPHSKWRRQNIVLPSSPSWIGVVWDKPHNGVCDGIKNPRQTT